MGKDLAHVEDGQAEKSKDLRRFQDCIFHAGIP